MKTSPVPANKKVKIQEAKIVPDTMTLGEAIDKTNEGKIVTRLEWKNEEIRVLLGAEYLIIKYPNKKAVPFNIRSADFGNDWVVVGVNKKQLH